MMRNLMHVFLVVFLPVTLGSAPWSPLPENYIAIYAAGGRMARTLALGHQSAGIYASRSRAAYWDGKNAQGEFVASGVYFYTLTAGEFTVTRKMLIRK